MPVKGKEGRSLLDDVMVRRLKEDLRAVQGGFPKRVVRQIDIDGLPDDAPELTLSILLNQYRELREERLKSETKRKQAAAALLISGLQQRLLSSIEAFARTLGSTARRWSGTGPWPGRDASKTAERQGEVQLDLISEGVDSDDDRATLSEEELQAEEDAQIEAASRAARAETRTAIARERAAPRRDDRIAEANRGRPDARIQNAPGLDPAEPVPGPAPSGATSSGPPARWNETRVLIFTEYDDTKRYLVQQLSDAIAATDRASQRIAVYHGPTPQAEREEIKRAFNTDPKKNRASDPHRDRRRSRRSESPDPLLEPLPFRRAVESQPDGAAQRTHRPQAPAEGRGLLPLLRLPPAVEDRILQALVRKTETIKRELGSLSQVLEVASRPRSARVSGTATSHSLRRRSTKTDLEAESRQPSRRSWRGPASARKT